MPTPYSAEFISKFEELYPQMLNSELYEQLKEIFPDELNNRKMSLHALTSLAARRGIKKLTPFVPGRAKQPAPQQLSLSPKNPTIEANSFVVYGREIPAVVVNKMIDIAEEKTPFSSLMRTATSLLGMPCDESVLPAFRHLFEVYLKLDIKEICQDKDGARLRLRQALRESLIKKLNGEKWRVGAIWEQANSQFEELPPLTKEDVVTIIQAQTQRAPKTYSIGRRQSANKSSEALYNIVIEGPNLTFKGSTTTDKAHRVLMVLFAKEDSHG